MRDSDPLPPDAPDRAPHAWRARAAVIAFGYGLSPAERAFEQRVLRERLALLSLLVAIGLAAWIPIDLGAVPRGETAAMLGIRLGAALLFVAIAAWARRPELGTIPLHALLVGFVLLQCAAFALLQDTLGNDAPPLLRLGYGLFPFIVAAQLALLPLPIAATALLSLPVFALLLLPAELSPFASDLSRLGALWLLSLIVAISAFAGASQLALLQGLLRARDDAAHDALTGLANRRMAMARLEGAIAFARRQRQPLALLAFDLDHFKRINDSFGHMQGDRVLVASAHAIDAELRRGDLGARIGGEEFIAILPGADLTAAAAVAERIRARIADTRVDTDEGHGIRFTISGGIATLGDSDNASSLLSRADATLYRAKQEGRNRIATAA